MLTISVTVFMFHMVNMDALLTNVLQSEPYLSILMVTFVTTFTLVNKFIIKSDVWLTVHRNSVWIGKTN